MSSGDKKEIQGWGEAVAQFTRGAATKPLPTKPIPMSSERVAWLCAMVMSELFELACTVAKPDDTGSQKEKALAILNDAMSKIDTNGEVFSEDPAETCANQADAIVDFSYYGLNVAAAHGIQMDPIFRLVHQANMTKVEYTISRRGTDGKILKPPGFQPPDITAEIKRQLDAEEQIDSPSKRLKMNPDNQ